MITRRAFLASASAAVPRPAFRQKVAIAMYSLRYDAAKNLAATLALIRDLGFDEVEAGDFYGRTPDAFAALLKTHGLRATSYGAAWDALNKDVSRVAAEARAIGASYVVCSTIPHSAKHLAERDCAPAAEHLNHWGERLTASGLHLCYHTHGTEFDPSPDGTRFDTLARLTDAKHANFEMDIFWIVYGGQDPARMLQKHRGRFSLMHIKDIRKGTVLGLTPADVSEDDSVPLGTGIVDVRAALLAAQEYGVKHYYLEEEAVDAVPQIRQSIRYLAGLR
jgi:sugar phosphate isomerase/epimerase